MRLDHPAFTFVPPILHRIKYCSATKETESRPENFLSSSLPFRPVAKYSSNVTASVFSFISST